jgi:hypothetical protein
MVVIAHWAPYTDIGNLQRRVGEAPAQPKLPLSARHNTSAPAGKFRRAPGDIGPDVTLKYSTRWRLGIPGPPSHAPCPHCQSGRPMVLTRRTRTGAEASHWHIARRLLPVGRQAPPGVVRPGSPPSTVRFLQVRFVRISVFSAAADSRHSSVDGVDPDDHVDNC